MRYGLIFNPQNIFTGHWIQGVKLGFETQSLKEVRK